VERGRLAVFGRDGAVRRLLAGLVLLPVILGGLNGLIVILLVFGLWHASVSLGVRLSLAFFAITTVTSWIFEEVGVVTGLVYGPYHYTAPLGTGPPSPAQEASSPRCARGPGGAVDTRAWFSEARLPRTGIRHARPAVMSYCR
jgi:hypothetical protein